MKKKEETGKRSGAMKHIFKKLHFGSSSQDPNRSNEIPAVQSPSPQSHGPEHPTVSNSPASPSSSSPTPVTTNSDPSDYFSSEEEFQVQLALAISASNSDFRDRDQIRAATILSLDRHRIDSSRQAEEAAELLSRRYWDYNVLDYEEKVVDGFYDIYGLSTDPASQGKMPSLVDLQTNIGDLGFEVLIVNRKIDPALEELEQVAHCIALDYPVSRVGPLVQRVADLVSEHMGGPVRDANDMLARWMEGSTQLRSSLQTSLLPIGCLNIGLSRHRALLFKVLADHVGIPCRLVKGSHYTGVDDDAVNMIKLENEREFLVDLMAAPGTLIPADILSTMDTPLNSYNPMLSKNLIPRTANNSGTDLSRTELLNGERKGENGKATIGNSGTLEGKSSFEKTLLTPSLPSASNAVVPGSFGNNPNRDLNSYQFPSSTSATSSQPKGNHSVPAFGDSVKEKVNIVPYSQDTVDPINLFADLNPFQMIGARKTGAQNKVTDNKINEFQKRRENIASGPGRPPLPLNWKNRSACNEVPRAKQYDFVDRLLPRDNLEAGVFHPSSSSPSSSATSEKIYPVPNVNAAEGSGISHSTGAYNGGGGKKSTSTGIFGSYPSVGGDSVPPNTDEYNKLVYDNGGTRRNNPLMSVQSPEEKQHGEDDRDGEVLQSSLVNELMEQPKNVNNKHDRRKFTHDRFMGTSMLSKGLEDLSLSPQAGPSSLDPMLDDVAEWEILWEDLVIGERIGLGSYGEVYHADWNGTEVAVKKFLDQDFSGDALDEFRSEVRIMRRLRHPNVVLFMGAVTRPPNLSIVTEFLPRGSLYRILHRPNCQIDEKRRIKMALDVAKGMNCLHTSIPTIVHRDLKSPNLLVDKNWNVKVCDFGLSRLKHNTFLSSKSTAGTPEWMAPEVLRNENSNEKCDVYSFGVILWELATLRMPWSGMNPMQVVGAVGFQNRRLDIPKEVDPLVARIIWECWQTDPSLRPSFAQLASALKPLQQLAISSHPDTQSPPMPQEISVNSTP
ncbi:protein kinase superfamily protein [Tasmannia lanceolata]|uniref:protein kinase superfamily protein n=1 Tax=Tasmannia lanceolata TaxID=3420 RepID=UPI00406312ED